MTSVFTYNDFRKFLADYYQEKKSKVLSFSYHNFSKKAGFASKSFVFNVIQGKKNLSSSSIVKLCEAMELNKHESSYFEKLVFFNQAANFKERAFFFEQLNAIQLRDKEGTIARKIRQDQYEYYSKWYHVTIRSLIDLFRFKDDYKRLARLVYPAITQQQAKKSVLLLERLGLIEKCRDGFFRVTNKLITTGKEVESHAILQYHIENMKLAENAIKTLPKDKRNVSGLTLGISQETYKKACELLFECQEQILSLAAKDKAADRVYQLNFHFFPLSRTD
jgi:uncharacterized protein (TIGR02147 family)